jgi:alkylation response protein AidB-like acyl-CoA dehydrogenase
LNFDYSDDQKHLKDEARRFLDDRAPLSVARAVLEDAQAGYDPALWRGVAELGWCGAAIPEAYGGLGMGYVDLCALAEELGRALAPIPFASSIYLFAEALQIAGSEAQKLELLPAVAGGELIGTLALSEGPGPVTPARLRTRFAKGGLTGEKLPVSDGLAAGRAVVLAADGDDRPGLYLVDLNGPGVAREGLSTVEPSRGAAKLLFTDAPAAPLGASADGAELLARILDRAAVLLAFEQVGGADRCLEMARDYALERYTFGRPIGSYQAIKHKLADVYVKNQVARANAYYAAWALSTGAEELPIAAAGARIAASAAYWLASKENIQTHGGFGFTWEADCHLFYRRARQLGLIIGAPRDWKRRLVDRLEAREIAEGRAS